ncbi:hypothetical protein P8452_21024 [Trifolium repens]|nr:hypothetical protein P8452_21024 [Trifolium repens]
MEDELHSIEKNRTCKLVNLPDKKRKIDVKWVFKVKLNPDGTISKHRARLVARGFLQKHGIDYIEVLAPVARIETVRLVVALACKNNWLMYHLDVKSAFLNGPLDEEVYVSQPPGFEIEGKEKMVFRLYKALYGLKQAPRAWNKRIDQFLIQIRFKKCAAEFGVYVQSSEGELAIICLYVDDLLITALSSCEAEYIVGTFAACQALWLDSVMKELECEASKPLLLRIDNKSAISLAKNPISHGRSKHIETKYHFIREQVSNGMIEIQYCPTELQLADGFTKALKLERFEFLRRQL